MTRYTVERPFAAEPHRICVQDMEDAGSVICECSMYDDAANAREAERIARLLNAEEASRPAGVDLTTYLAYEAGQRDAPGWRPVTETEPPDLAFDLDNNTDADHSHGQLGEVEAERDRLRAFAVDVLGDWPDNCGCDGFELQELAVKHGLLKDHEVAAHCADDDNCGCQEHHDPADGPWTCYRKTPLLTGESDGE